jgi:hypothetical protein
VRHFSTVKYGSGKSSGIDNVGQQGLTKVQVAREVSVNVSNTSSSSIN